MDTVIKMEDNVNLVCEGAMMVCQPASQWVDIISAKFAQVHLKVPSVGTTLGISVFIDIESTMCLGQEGFPDGLSTNAWLRVGGVEIPSGVGPTSVLISANPSNSARFLRWRVYSPGQTSVWQAEFSIDVVMR